MARISLNEAMARPANVDQEKLDATTEQDIRRYQAEDGYADVEAPDNARTVIPPRQLRVSLGLTQKEMAAQLRIPFDTWRNWETGRVRLDPAVRSLLDIVAAAPEAAFAALDTPERRRERHVTALQAQGFRLAPETVSLDMFKKPVTVTTNIERVSDPVNPKSNKRAKTYRATRHG